MAEDPLLVRKTFLEPKYNESFSLNKLQFGPEANMPDFNTELTAKKSLLEMEIEEC